MERTRGFEVAKGWEDKKINLPRRQTENSAGYDFECAEDTRVPSLLEFLFQAFKRVRLGDKMLKPTLVPTGIKAYFQNDEALFIYNRSGNPLKKYLLLTNGVGIIDADYYGNPDNDGHIQFQFYNLSPFPVTIKKGERIGQGVFKTFLTVDNDEAEGKRVGGMGSTN